ncbi:hypothetical protein K491DRAFT_719546 [Lophiostoma macrostomum CBS 122681]|uniref:Uncharacterized protein n=1 Tax=Lophiostoma macrostomum CBS 122681 TaxID=1314788 RepID=A0A6A6SXM0_9PLEO|nr:hypothetical protein K491DRAFT_719546 [Lophiostoma macrostomum CBS 122681]
MDSGHSDYTSPRTHPSTYEAQWCSLQHHLHARPVPENELACPTWLSCLDIRILLTALAKQRAEVALLESEASYTESSTSSTGSRETDIEIEFPNYSLGFAGNQHRPQHQDSFPSPAEPQKKHRPPPITSAEMLFLDTSTDSPPKTNDPPKTDEASPLSPSFGPRRSTPFSGTVSRRRSSQYSPLSPHHPALGSQSQTSTPSQTPTRISSQNQNNAKSIATASTKRDVLEQRIQFEAAWTGIERNLGAYVDRFAAAATGTATNAAEEGGDRLTKEDVWREMVVLRERGDGLAETLRRARAGR